MQKLWSKNFSILTIGAIISTLGNAVSNFAIGLLIYNKTESTFLYALFFIITMMPKVLFPLFIGTYLDRFSRRKVIYIIDFIYGAMFLLVFYAVFKDYYQYGVFLSIGIIMGTLESIYEVAYESFYPELITEGNFSKAYSISSIIYPIANTIMVPIAGFAYKTIGLAPIFLFNALTFFVTAVLEMQIKVQEKHVKEDAPKYKLIGYKTDFKEGLSYLKREKGLRSITIYFFITMLASAVSGTLIQPYFQKNDAVMQLSYIMAIATFGRVIGAVMHYKYKYPINKRFMIAAAVYITISVLEGSFFFMPFAVMMVFYFVIGILGVTSFNIRISSTQNYLSSDMRGRFNGLFIMITTAGTIIGQLSAGILGEFYPIPYIVAAFMILNVIAVFAVVIRNKEHISKIYNQDI